MSKESNDKNNNGLTEKEKEKEKERIRVYSDNQKFLERLFEVFAGGFLLASFSFLDKMEKVHYLAKIFFIIANFISASIIFFCVRSIEYTQEELFPRTEDSDYKKAANCQKRSISAFYILLFFLVFLMASYLHLIIFCILLFLMCFYLFPTWIAIIEKMILIYQNIFLIKKGN